ncbi:uncharacterized protein LOC124942180 [Impatiens glandulifera]|uniref:uncharacterized protein LOC124942180 n=1 Tax=Impatiens glandulifera TaxID=253017 RepID=UPI001FB19F1E|nr:uncharacterized protein LOC124942180 [Impatiens glandulifera]
MMAEEVVDIPVDKDIIDIPMDRETIIDIKPPPQRSKQLDVVNDDSHEKRTDITTEYSTTPKSEAKVLSRYLRASSLASCHDLCKFGHKHNSEEEPRIPLSRIIRIRLAEMRNQHKTSDLDPKMKEIVNSPKSFPNSKDKHQKKIRQEVLPSPLKLVVLLQKDPMPIKKRPNISGDLTKPVPTKLRFAIRSKSHTTVVKPLQPVKKVASSVKSFVGAVTGMLPKNQKITRKSDEFIKRSDRNVSSTKVKSKENSQKEEEKKRRNINAPCGNCFTQQSPLHKGNMKYDKTLIQTSNSNAKGRSSTGRARVIKTGDSTRKLNSKRGKLVVNSPTKINTSPSEIMFNPTEILVENGYENSNMISCSLNKSVTDELDRSDTEEQQPKQIIEKNGEEEEVNEKGAQNLSNIDEEKDKVDSSRKLIFKKGKIIDNNQPQNISPMRLMFKLSRVIVDCQNTKVHTRISGLKSKDIDKLDYGVNEKNREQVVLKHRLVEGKKDSQSLINNVIEERANKLVESRKSKVKALVGAFESVISLQDTKPLATVNSS